MTRKTVGGTWKEIARRFLHRATWDRKSECERRKDIVARKRSYATRRTYDRITRNTEKEREKERSSYRGPRRAERRTEERSDVACDECNEEHANRDAFVEERSASGTERSHEHAGRRKRGRQREEGCSDVEKGRGGRA